MKNATRILALVFVLAMVLTCFAGMLTTASAADAPTPNAVVDFGDPATLAGVSLINDCKAEQDNGFVRFTGNGNDPHIALFPSASAPVGGAGTTGSMVDFVVIKYRTKSTATGQFYWSATDNTGWAENNPQYQWNGTNEWSYLIVDASEKWGAKTAASLYNIRFDFIGSGTDVIDVAYFKFFAEKADAEAYVTANTVTGTVAGKDLTADEVVFNGNKAYYIPSEHGTATELTPVTLQNVGEFVDYGYRLNNISNDAMFIGTGTSVDATDNLPIDPPEGGGDAYSAALPGETLLGRGDYPSTVGGTIKVTAEDKYIRIWGWSSQAAPVDTYGYGYQFGDNEPVFSTNFIVRDEGFEAQVGGWGHPNPRRFCITIPLENLEPGKAYAVQILAKTDDNSISTLKSGFHNFRVVTGTDYDFTDAQGNGYVRNGDKVISNGTEFKYFTNDERHWAVKSDVIVPVTVKGAPTNQPDNLYTERKDDGCRDSIEDWDMSYPSGDPNDSTQVGLIATNGTDGIANVENWITANDPFDLSTIQYSLGLEGWMRGDVEYVGYILDGDITKIKWENDPDYSVYFDQALINAAPWIGNCRRYMVHVYPDDIPDGYHTIELVHKLQGDDKIYSLGWNTFWVLKGEANDQYTFSDYTYSVVAAPGEVTYTATFMDINGDVVARVNYAEGATSIAAPTVPAINGYDGYWNAYTLGSNVIVTPYYVINEDLVDEAKVNVQITIANGANATVTITDGNGDATTVKANADGVANATVYYTTGTATYTITKAGYETVSGSITLTNNATLTTVTATLVEKTCDHANKVDANVVNATCGANGSKDIKCGDCGETLETGVVIPATGEHNYQNPVDGGTITEATCTEDKVINYVYTCTGCGDTYSRPTTVPGTALGHSEIIISGYGASCIETGLTDGKKCTVCGETTVAQEEIPVIPHTEVVVPGKGATCTEDGLTEGKKCFVCGEITAAQETIPASGHSPAAAVKENEVAATCGANGSYDNVVYCSICEAELSRETETVPATGAHVDANTDLECDVCGAPMNCEHGTLAEAVKENIVNATCTTDGSYDTVVYCAICSKEMSRTPETIPATGHTAAEAVKENIVNATCGADGSYDNVVYCSICEAELSRETETVPATGEHVYATETERVNATCTEDGYVVMACGCGATEKTTLVAPGHTAAEAVKENEIVATCGSDGSYDEVVYCSACGAELSRETIEVPSTGEHVYATETERVDATCTEDGYVVKACGCGATEKTTLVAPGHTEVNIPSVNPTCTGNGAKDGKKCDVCGEITVTPTVVPAKGHTEEVVPGYPATLDAPGLTDGVVCTGCGETLVEQKEIPQLEEECAHANTYESVTKPATCAATGLKNVVCSDCGEIVEKDIEISATGIHKYGAPATCTAPQKCTVCDTVLTPAKGHNVNVDEAIETKDATCTAYGYNVYKCRDCDYTITVYGKEYAAHDFNIENATCTEAKKCSVCDYVDEKATGHAYVAATTDPTCTEQGYTTHICTKCGDVQIDAYVDALGHNAVVDAAVNATCTVTGLTEGSHCATCGEILVAQEVVDALGHTEEIIPGTLASCLEGGITDGAYCTVCGETTVEQVELPAQGHTEAEAVVENVNDADCVNDGSYDSVIYCSVCGEELSRETVITDALGHTEVVDEAVDATCTTDGKTQGSHCETCGAIIEAQTIIPATGHTNKTVAGYAATCTENGLTDGIVCSVCDEVLTEQTVIVAPGHSTVVLPAVAATCTETGLTEGAKCTVCGTVTVKQEITPVIPHTLETLAEVAPTCSATGLTEGKKCIVCDTVIVAQKVVDKKAHTEIDVPAVAPTCTEAGLTAGKKCSVCGEIIVAQETVAALGHVTETVAGYAPTCTETGLTAGEKCAVCGEILTAQTEIAATGHTEIELPAVAATCTSTGLTAGKKCTICGTITEAQEITPVIAHTEVTLDAVAATCTADGKTEGKKCSVCGEITVAQMPIRATGHANVTVPGFAATCTEAGKTAGVKCSVCNETIVAQTAIAPTGHSTVDLAAVAATCTETGLTAGKKCIVCGVTTVAQEVVEALGHTEVAIPAVDATCTETGLTEGKKCTVCDEITVAQEVVEALGHTEIDVPGKAATCTEKGLSDGKVCDVCGVITVAQNEIAALGHTEAIIPAVDATYESTGLTEGKKCSVCDEILVAQTVTDKLPAKGDDEQTTDAPATDAPATEAPATTAPSVVDPATTEAEGGCGSVIGMSAAAVVLAAAAAAVALKKKED